MRSRMRSEGSSACCIGNGCVGRNEEGEMEINSEERKVGTEGHEEREGK